MVENTFCFRERMHFLATNLTFVAVLYVYVVKFAKPGIDFFMVGILMIIWALLTLWEGCIKNG